MELSTGVSLLRTAQSLLTGRTIQGIDFHFVQNAGLGADAAYEMFESQISQVVKRQHQ